MLSKTVLPSVLALCAVQCLIIALITHIFPFIAAFLLSLNVPPEQVATYSGLAESLVSFGDLVFLPLHIKLIHWFPHRYLMITSLLLSGAVAAMMGFSKHIWQILLLRGLTALFSFGGFLANIALGEVVKQEEGGQAFSIFASATFLGAMLGSMVGGYMAESNGRVPILGRMEVFRERPYIAPGLAMGALTILGALAIWLLVPETNPRYRLKGLAETTVGETELLLEHSEGSGITFKELWQDARFWNLNLVDVLNKACFFTCLTLMSTAGKLSPDLGGLGLTVPTIGTILFLTPLLTSINLIFLFSIYSDKVSTRTILILSSLAWMLPAIFFPIATQIRSEPRQTPIYALWYIGHAVGMTWWALRGSLTVDMYPNPADRAVAAGILEQSGNLGCILGVAGSSRLFALSSQYPAGTLGRQIVWIWFSILACLTVTISACLPRQLTVKSGDSDDASGEDEEANERTGLLQ